MACSTRASSCWTFCRASFHRRSNSLATKRLSGSVASYCFSARRALYWAASNSLFNADMISSCCPFSCSLANTAASIAAGSSTVMSSRLIASSRLKPANVMQGGSPLSNALRWHTYRSTNGPLPVPPTTPTSQQTSQQGGSSLHGARPITKMCVMGHHVLDLFKLLPANVALMRVANQYPPLVSWFTPTSATWWSLLILHGMLGFAVRIRARVRRIRQHAVEVGVPRSSPDHLIARRRNRNLQSVFQEP